MKTKLSWFDRGLIGLIIAGLIILIILIAGCFHKSDQAIRTAMIPQTVYVDREGPTVTQTVTNEVTRYMTKTAMVTTTLTETIEVPVPVTTTVVWHEVEPGPTVLVPGPTVTKTTSLPGVTTTVVQPTTTTITITKTIPAPTTTKPRCDH